MKRYILLVSCIFLLLTLHGCSVKTKETPKSGDSLHTAEETQYDTLLYSITVEDGQYYLTPKTTQSHVDASMAFPVPEFQSIGEMRQSIINGSFTDQELYALSRHSQRPDGGIQICDVDHLYECTAPDEFVLDKIQWYGKHYSWELTDETVRGVIYCYNEEEYTENLNKKYKDFLSNPHVTLIEQQETDERSATVYYGKTSYAKVKDICYAICVGDKKMLIQERYLLETEVDGVEVSSDVPRIIEFWGIENGGYFYGYFFYFKERPSVEWLSEFGITPYSA